MAEKSTFIKLDRKILDWEYYENITTFKLFIHLLLTANIKDKSWKGITVKRGQLVTSLENLSQQTGLSVQQVRTALKNLISTNTVTNSSYSKFRIISIKNYDSYQGGNKAPHKQITNNQQTDNKQITTTKEYKECKEKKNINNILSVCADSFNSVCKSFPKVKVLSDGRKRAVKKLIDSGIDLIELFERAEGSDFLTGRSGSWKNCSFDWIINYNNALKILEGNYDNADKQRREELDEKYREYNRNFGVVI